MKERKRLKRFVALFVAFTMVLSPFNVFAYDDKENHEYGLGVGQEGIFATGDPIHVISANKKHYDGVWTGIYPVATEAEIASPSLSWYSVTGLYQGDSGSNDFNDTWIDIRKWHGNNVQDNPINHSNFTGAAAGSETYKNYMTAIFANDSYDSLVFSQPVKIRDHTFKTNKTAYNCNEDITVTLDYPGRYSNPDTGAALSWVGLYKKTDEPGESTPSIYYYDIKDKHAKNTKSNYSFNLRTFMSTRNAGEYKLVMFYDQGYTKKDTVNFTISHNYQNTVTAPTCLAQGYTTHTCKNCGHSYVDTYTSQLTHHYEYTASGNVITEKCNRGCNHTATATLKGAGDQTYTGDEIKPLTVEYSNNWQGGKDLTVSYANNVIVGTAKGSITKNSATANNTFNIVKAPNKWTNGPTMNGWVYGKTASTPSAKAKFGDWTVKYKVNGAADSTYTTTKPSTPGDYVALFTVAETDNYYGLSTPVEFTISKAQIPGVNVVPYEGTYDGENHGIIVNAPTNAKITYSTKENGTYKEENPQYKDAGSYTVWYKVELENYNTVTGSANVNISKASATVTANDAGKVYGKEDPPLEWTAAGLITGETLTDISISRATGQDVGTYNITVGQKTGANPNYNITFVPGKFTITKANMTVNATPYNGIYDGEKHGITVNAPTNAKITYRTSEEDPYKEEYPAFKDAGTYTVYYKVEMANYKTEEGSATVKISQKEIGLKWGDTVFTYDGTAKLPAVEAQGIEGSDAISVTVEGQQTAANTDAHPAYTATATAITGEGANNYKLPTDDSVSFKINPRPASVAVKEGQGKVYGKTEPVLEWTADGLVEGETLTDIIISRVDGEDAGEYDITVNQAAGANPNYVITFQNGIFTITNADMSADVSAEGWTGIYDGKEHNIKVTAPEGAKVTYSTSETGTYEVDNLKYKEAGTYTVWYKVEKKNYDTVVGSADIVINQAPVTVTAVDKSKVYGEEDPVFESLATGSLVEGEVLTDLTIERQAGEDVGAYTITVGQAVDANPNYDVTFVDGTFTIKEAQLHATVAQKGTLTYDEGKALTPEVTKTDDARLNQKVTFTYSMSEDGTYGDMPTFTKAGTYTVYFKADAPNHKGASGSFVVTVEKAKVEKPKADDTKFVYNGTEQKYGIPANDVYTVTNDKRTDAGSQDVKVALKDKDNYEWTDGTQDDLTYEFKIAPLGIYADWGKTEDLVYNGEDQLPTPKPTGLKGDDTCDLTAKWTDDKEGVGVMPGTWDAGIVDVSNPNYYIINDETPVIIVKAPQEKPEVSGVDETIKDKNDGIIKDVDDKMEYRKDGEDTWTPITEDEVKNLPDDKYFVRYEETETHLPSPETEVVIGPGRDLTVTVPEEQPGYELTTEDDKLPWNGDTVIDFTLEEGYQKTDDFAVLVNDEKVELDENDQYIIKDAQEDIVITVVGVEKMPAVEAPEAEDPTAEPEEDNDETPTTGDSNNIWMWLALLMAGSGAAVFTEKRRRRH